MMHALQDTAFAIALSLGWCAIALAWIARRSGILPRLRRRRHDVGIFARIAAVAALAAVSVYGGSKPGGTTGLDGAGAFTVPRPAAGAGSDAQQPGDRAEAPANGLRFTAFAVDGDRFDFSVAWPATNSADWSAIDVFHKERLDDASWRWVKRRSAWPEDGETQFSLYGYDLPCWETKVSRSFRVYTNEVESPFGVVFTNLYARVPEAHEPRSAFFMLAGQHDADGDGLSDAVERSLGYDPADPDMDADGLPDGQELALGADPLEPDSDGDGLTDGTEVSWGSDPTKADTDGDGLPDAVELELGTDPCDSDTDGDGLSDSAEVSLGTNPLLSDTDGDGIVDEWECDHPRFDPLDPSDGLADTDGDGLSNAFEITRSNTDWTLSDTDGDGLADGTEWNGSTDPLNPDTDGDGLSDGQEISLGTDPCDDDSDGDGFSDGWERLHCFDPLDDSDPEGGSDPDADGISNSREFELGTNPLEDDTDGDGLSDGEECGTVAETAPMPDDMAGSTDILPLFEDLDDGAVSIQLPFAVGPAWAEPCSNLVVGIDGTLALAVDTETSLPDNPSSSHPATIHAFSDDLLACTNELGSSLSFAVSGQCGVRRFVLEYRAFGFSGVTPAESDSVSFRVAFCEEEPDCVRVSFFHAAVNRAGSSGRPLIRSSPESGAPSDRALGSNAELGVVSERGRIAFSSRRAVAIPGLSLEYRFGTGTSPVLPDTDGDGLGDGAEPGIGTNPLDRDSDRDGMDDGWEMSYFDVGFDPLLPNGSDGNPDNDADADPDGDGLTNGRESELWTNPLSADTDGDGIADGDESAQGSDPNDRADTIPVKWAFLTGDLGRGETKTTNATVAIPAGTMAFAGVFAFSEEYPHYTGQSSEFNDWLEWRVAAGGESVMRGSTRVNNEDGAWDAAADRGQSLRGLAPVVLKDKALLAAPGDADLAVQIELKAQNVSDGRLPSSLVVGFFPLKLVQSNMPTATGAENTTDSGNGHFRAFIPTGGVAYITGQPAAPELTAQFKGLPGWIDVDWEMTLSSERQDHRFEGIDDRSIERETRPGTGFFDITGRLNREIVGGACSLGVQIGDSCAATYPFRIRGKNPLDATAKSYIDAAVDAEFRPYAWMIAKHESKSGTRVYNQFNASGDKKELPNFAEPYGWGIAQIDKGRNGDSTAEVYDWHENVASMNATLREKRARYHEILRLYRSAYQNDPSTHWFEPDNVTTNVNGTNISARQWAIMTLYNGAGGTRPLAFPGHENERTPIHFDPVTTNWVLYTNSNNYVPVVLGDAEAQEVE